MHALAETFVVLAGARLGDSDLLDLLDRFVGECVRRLGATAGGLLLDDQCGHLVVVCATGGGDGLLEALRLQDREGPSRDCLRQGRTVACGELARQSARWPLLTAVARTAGFGSVCAAPLCFGQRIGCLTVFDVDAEPLGAGEQRRAQCLADVVAIALQHQRGDRSRRRLSAELRQARDSRP